MSKAATETIASQTIDWESLIRENYHSLLQYCFVLTRNPDDAEDIVQETFSRVLESNRRFPTREIQNYAGYLRRVARNLFFDRRNGERFELHFSLDDNQNKGLHLQLVDESTSIENRLYHKELMRSLPWNSLLRGFDEREVKMLWMSATEEMTLTEIARVFDEDQSVVRYRLQKLYAKIRYRVKTTLGRDRMVS